MKWISLGKRGAVSVLALSACAAVAAPLLPLGGDPGSGSGESEKTTIRLKCDADSQPIVLELNDMRVGETRDVVAESGKPVTVSRVEDGYRIKVGDKDIDVKTPGDLPGARVMVFSGDEGGDHARKTMVMSLDSSDSGPGRKVFVRHGSGAAGGHAFAFRTGDRKALTPAELLDGHDLQALRGADRRTRETVAQALAELMEKGAVIAPQCQSLAGIPGAVEIEVDTQRTTDNR